ncbi:hypothetical protein JB92DRAFT_903055 [Gautieria morchelliformis]|nr:hypothetical protein JB92DRAFT_903055 [Gautieria morchelliformis]
MCDAVRNLLLVLLVWCQNLQKNDIPGANRLVEDTSEVWSPFCSCTMTCTHSSANPWSKTLPSFIAGLRRVAISLTSSGFSRHPRTVLKRLLSFGRSSVGFQIAGRRCCCLKQSLRQRRCPQARRHRRCNSTGATPEA